MPSLKDFAPEINLAKDESVTVQIACDGVYEQQEKTYLIPVLRDGQPAKLKGGKRLMNAVFAIIKPRSGVVTIKVTAHGEPRTFERDYEVKLV